MRAVATSSSISRILRPSTPSIDFSETGHIFFCLRPGALPSLPSSFAGIAHRQSAEPVYLQAGKLELVGAQNSGVTRELARTSCRAFCLPTNALNAAVR